MSGARWARPWQILVVAFPCGAFGACLVTIDDSKVDRAAASHTVDAGSGDTGAADAPPLFSPCGTDARPCIPIFLADTQPGPISMVVGAAVVSWTNIGDTRLEQIAIEGGIPAAVGDSNTPGVPGIAADDAGVYWAANFTVLRSPPAGGQAVPMAQGSIACPVRLGADGTSVYVADHCTSGRVLKINETGPAEVTVLSRGAYPFDPSTYSGLTLVGDRLFLTVVHDDGSDVPDGLLETMLTDGGSRETLSGSQPNAKSVAADGAGVYWFTTGASPARVGHLMARSPLSAPETIVADIAAPTALALDAQYLYWASQGTPPAFTDGAIVRLSRDGGSPEVLAKNRMQPMVLVNDATTLYWGEWGAGLADGGVPSNGSIWKMAK